MSRAAGTARVIAPRRPKYKVAGRAGGSRGIDGQPLRLERRRDEREPATGSLAATYTDGRRYGITHLELIDRSPTGLGVRTRTAIEPGMTVTVCPEGSTVPWLSGTAVRCTPEGQGYHRVGVVFERRRAA